LGNRLHVNAAIGAAITPPIKNATTISQRNFSNPIVKKKVEVIANVTKNSEKSTEPTALWGSVPFTIRVGVQIGPHPPPPIASIKPPKHPSALSLLIEYDFVWLFGFLY